MTIALRPMRADEFPAYLSYFVPDYAAEISANYDLPADAAEAQARREIAKDLPAGAATPDQVLLCVVDDERGEEIIGYCSYRPDKDARLAFIYDFHIRPEYQDKGYGTKALAVLEADLAAAGFEQIQLRVAADNVRAQHVYQSGGFRTTGINMSKRIGDGRTRF